MTPKILVSLCLFLTGFWSVSIPDPNDEEEVVATIEQLFEGMRNKNQALLKGAFHEEAVMHTVGNSPDGTQLGSNTVNDFINRIVEIPPGTILDERIIDYKISIDGDMAAAWTSYMFYINDEFSHCGVNSFQLIRIQGEWKITYVIDTRRKNDCH
ncbi:nuclear transport factor 2 family protein [Pararhodonellum marinum]|uniref:nuclear transport factor 2 family protein n=1 Tax=Pararhodonellum marinum TaxID=2755358 RepID=UPI00188EFE47|nr:nuclear transport factor 2 family protein [Pararhodonellum marinum]